MTFNEPFVLSSALAASLLRRGWPAQGQPDRIRGRHPLANFANGLLRCLDPRKGLIVTKIVYVLNGPNLNLLGKRQPHIYGHETLADIEAACRQTAAELGFEIRFHQSNAESQIIEWIHEALETASGIVINPAALTHTSVAILDALNACEFPVFEVHISNVHKREAFRQRSFVSLRADGVIAGLGTQGYTLALRRLGALLAAGED